MSVHDEIAKVIECLGSDDAHVRSLAFHLMSKWKRVGLPGPLKHVGGMADNWWSLLKENCRLVTKPFMAFSDTILAALRREQWRMSEFESLFYEYIGNDAHFLSLRSSTTTSVVELPGVPGVGKLVSTVCGKDDFLVVSGARKDYMPVYDFTASGTSLDWLLDTYARLIAAIPGCQVCLVEKKVGPFGPAKHMELLRQRHPGVNFFLFSQFGDEIVEGEAEPVRPVIILYDLLATGDGLNRHVARGLLSRYGDRLRDCPVYACVIHVFDEDKPGPASATTDVWERRMCSYASFVDADERRKNPDVSPHSLADDAAGANFLSKVIYLHRGTLADMQPFTITDLSGNKEYSNACGEDGVHHHYQKDELYAVACS